MFEESDVSCTDVPEAANIHKQQRFSLTVNGTHSSTNFVFFTFTTSLIPIEYRIIKKHAP